MLAEASFHLQDARVVLAMVEEGLVLADLCLIRLSELNPRHSVITTDVEDFRVYRRNKREAIPLISPPS